MDITLPNKNVKRWQRYKTEYETQFSCIMSSRPAEYFAFCKLCCSDIGIKNSGLYDITKHFVKEKHKGEAEKVKPVPLGSSIKSFFSNDDDLETIQAEAFLCGFLVEHNIPLIITEHARALL